MNTNLINIIPSIKNKFQSNAFLILCYMTFIYYIIESLFNKKLPYSNLLIYLSVCSIIIPMFIFLIVLALEYFFKLIMQYKTQDNMYSLFKDNNLKIDKNKKDAIIKMAELVNNE